MWLKTTKNYPVGCAFEIELSLLLSRAEGFQKHTLTPEEVGALASWSGRAITNYEVNRLDRELWSFLNLNLLGECEGDL